MTNIFEQKITIKSLLKQTFPTIIMMLIFSLYTIIDGIFISQYVGDNALAATNIVFPCINILLGIGIMFATGGSAVIAKKMGEGKNEEANRNLSLITLSALISGVIIAILFLAFIDEILIFLGSTEILQKDCYSYLSIMLLFSPFIILKVFFDYFLVTGGASKLGLISSITGGIVNIILDYVFIVNFNMGVAGAALATTIGYVLPSVIGLVYFSRKKSILRFQKPHFTFKVISKSCINGSSEMVNQLASSITTLLYNMAMLKFLGEAGVSAITIILYIQFLLNAAYLGFTSGVSPRISYNYGKKNKSNLRNLVKYSYLIISFFGVIIFIVSQLMSKELILLFATKNSEVFYIALIGFKIFAFSFLVSGINIFTSGMFTAYSNGVISALLSLLRSLILFIIGIAILPRILGVNGVWLVVPVCELITLIISLLFINKYKEKYMYNNRKIII